MKYLLNRKSGLFYHGWNFEEQSNYGGNFFGVEEIAGSRLWYPAVLEIMNGYLAKSSERYLLNLYNNQVKSLLEIGVRMAYGIQF